MTVNAPVSWRKVGVRLGGCELGGEKEGRGEAGRGGAERDEQSHQRLIKPD